MRYKNIFILIGSIYFLVSCASDRPDVKPEKMMLATPGAGVFITNEGNFQWGNASVSYYHFSDQAVTSDIFKAVNTIPLGDVCQSMTIFEDKAYIVVNNSGKVEIVDPGSFASLGTIKGLTSPRYFLGVSGSKAYITDIYSQSIAVVDLHTHNKIKDIPCSGATEELIMANDKVFVTNTENNYVYVVNPVSDILEDSILVGWGSNSIRQDKYGKLWVLCRGNEKDKAASLHTIDPVTLQVTKTLVFKSMKDTPWRLKINGSGDMLYYLNKGVYKFSVEGEELPLTPLISQNGVLFYGLGIDPRAGDIYVSDAIDYVQKGKVYRYDSGIVPLDTFHVGAIPGDFYFY